MLLKLAQVPARIWDLLNGYKAVIGLLLTLIGFLAGWLPALAMALPALPLVLKVAGAVQLLNGLLHRAYKLVYGVEHP